MPFADARFINDRNVEVSVNPHMVTRVADATSMIVNKYGSSEGIRHTVLTEISIATTSLVVYVPEPLDQVVQKLRAAAICLEAPQ